MRKCLLIIMTTLLLNVPLTVEAATSVWSTTYGDLNIHWQDDDIVMGTYEQYPEGFVFLRHNGEGRYDGYWSQTSSEVKCAWSERGRGYKMTNYWGELVLDATNNGTSFHGKWSYCDKPPSGTWDGKLR